MQTPLNLNEQHLWGGKRLQPFPDNSQTNDGDIEQTTIVGPGQQDPGIRPSFQPGFIASSSDNLFHPVVGGPSSHAYHLPDIPLHSYPHYHPPRPLPHPSSSYNNPTFSVPSPLSHPLPINLPFNQFGPLPLIPPCPCFLSQPVYDQFPPHSTAYIQPQVTGCNHCPSVLSALPKTLPTVSHVPILTSKHDFFAWDEVVNSLIHANGLISHILDPSAPVDPGHLDLAPTPIPVIPAYPSASDVAALSRWWAKDSIAQHILVSHLSTIPRGLLPSANLVTQTALISLMSAERCSAQHKNIIKTGEMRW